MKCCGVYVEESDSIIFTFYFYTSQYKAVRS